MRDRGPDKAFACYSPVNLLVSCAYAKAHLSAEKA